MLPAHFLPTSAFWGAVAKSYEYFTHALPTITHFGEATTPPVPWQPPIHHSKEVTFAAAPASASASASSGPHLLSCTSHTRITKPRIQSQLVVMPRRRLLLFLLTSLLLLLLLLRFRPTMTHSRAQHWTIFYDVATSATLPHTTPPHAQPLAPVSGLTTHSDTVANTIFFSFSRFFVWLQNERQTLGLRRIMPKCFL